MTRCIVAMIVVAGLSTTPASAGLSRGDGGGPPDVGLPRQALAALENVAAALEADAGDADPAADARLAAATQSLASSVQAIPAGDRRAFAAFVALQSMLLGREISSRLRSGSLPEEGRLLAALDELAAQTRAWAEREAHAGADGPETRCFLDLGLCMAWCATLPTAVLRVLCAFDCETDFARCMAEALKPIRDWLPGFPGVPSVPSLPF